MSFVVVEHRVLDLIPRIGSTAFAVYAALKKYADRDGACFPSEQTLATTIGASVSTVRRAIRQLEAHGLIHVRRQGSRRPNLYQLTQSVRSSVTGQASSDRSNLLGQKAGEQSPVTGQEALTGQICTGDRSPVTGELDTGTKKRARNFVKPTVEEVRAYGDELNATVDPETFVDHYESNGWKVGRSEMKDWKATFRNWNRREKDSANGRTNGRPASTGQNYRA